MKNAVFNWSGGKDSALALWQTVASGEYRIVSLLTTVNRDTERSSMHGIPISLLERQAESIGIPLTILELPSGEMAGYESAMSQAVERFMSQGVDHFIFGDIFLHDVRSYREKHLSPYGVTVVEPLWGKSSAEVMEDYLASGLRTTVITTESDALGREWIGRTIDRRFVDELPSGVDPCGENGEYHTFCYDGPIFSRPVSFSLGETVKKCFPVKLDDGTEKRYCYWFADISE